MRNASSSARSSGVFMRGYISEMGEHPQTIGYSLLDSPIGLAAWMLDHDADSYAKIAKAFARGRTDREPQPRQRPRQHHALLGDGHRGLDLADLLGDGPRRNASLKNPPPHMRLPAALHGLPGRALPGAAALGEARLPPPRLLQRGAEGRALRGVGGAGDLRAGAAGGVRVAPQRTRVVSATATAAEIRPFELEFPQAQVDDLRRRLDGDALAEQGARRRPLARRPARDPEGARPTTGRASTTSAGLEERLNALPQFTTEIDGLRRPLHPRPLAARRRAAAR